MGVIHPQSHTGQLHVQASQQYSMHKTKNHVSFQDWFIRVRQFGVEVGPKALGEHECICKAKLVRKWKIKQAQHSIGPDHNLSVGVRVPGAWSKLGAAKAMN
eukprot:1139963-Pelagomonas_calceolata.AAC.5